MMILSEDTRTTQITGLILWILKSKLCRLLALRMWIVSINMEYSQYMEEKNKRLTDHSSGRLAATADFYRYGIIKKRSVIKWQKILA